MTIDLKHNIPLLHRLKEPHEFEGYLTTEQPSGADELVVSQDDLIEYAVLLRPAFDRLNRVIAQLAGLFILARVHGRFDRDLGALVTCVERASCCVSIIESIVPPRSVFGQYQNMKMASHLVQAVTAEFDQSIPPGYPIQQAIDRWTGLLVAAHKRMRQCADASLGLNVIDFSQGCCASHQLLKPLETRKMLGGIR